MPGEIPLPTTEYPDEFFVLTRGFNPGTEQYLPIAVFDRDMVVDGWKVRYEVNNGSALTGNLAKAADGVAMSTNTNVTTLNGVDFNDGDTVKTSAVIATDNILKAGELLLLEFNAAPSGTLAHVTVMVRMRSRVR